MPLTSPRLWIIATPLGNPGDLSPRARGILESCELILAEDTRRAAQLCRLCGITAHRFLSFYDHNEVERQEEVLQLLRDGHDVALISDAGTPLVADPGYRLVRACRREGLPVSPVPGPSAPVAALSAAGIAPLPYSFLGFMPRDKAGRERTLRPFAHVPGSLIFFERKDRLADSLDTALSILGPRDLAICRELTKTHEEFILTRLERPADLPQELLGEITVIIGPPEVEERSSRDTVEALLREELSRGGKPREVARRVQPLVRGWNGKELYALLSQLSDSPED